MVLGSVKSHPMDVNLAPFNGNEQNDFTDFADFRIFFLFLRTVLRYSPTPKTSRASTPNLNLLTTHEEWQQIRTLI